MPQLFPMNWNLLTLYFMIIMIMMTMLLYFNYKPISTHSKMNKKTFVKFWKW
uniref:ATP synthase subunit 8 n=1 Tax=Subparmatus marinkellei TaxID=1442168 RepID=W0FDL1_9ACAR|nr:ATP synthase subunit 8 [Subparmatus marinkellei]